MAANEQPSINDITAAELAPVLRRAADGDALIRRCLEEGALSVVSSGNDLGVIDLSKVRFVRFRGLAVGTWQLWWPFSHGRGIRTSRCL